jgi:hypothetical protein
MVFKTSEATMSLSLPVEYYIFQPDVELEGPFPTLSKAKTQAETLARVNKGVAFHVYRVTRVPTYFTSCVVSQPQWYTDIEKEKENENG